ncbi:MAG TPA: hypothetical protein PKG63_00265 [Bacteroidales bacterium]|jgi:hypothetical protein|nr:hypothetical protein [Bacteroidales bacterium]
MMKKIFFSLIIVAFLFSCTKYEDGPIFTFRSKTKRIAHSWEYEAIIYTETGISVTTNLPNTVMTFSKDGTYSENNGYTGSWKFKGDIELEISKSMQGDSTITTTWEITRLSNKELWLRKDKVDHHFKAK